MEKAIVRLYPDRILPFVNEPTADRFYVRKFDDNLGEGLVSLVDFEPGEIVFSFSGDFYSEITLFTLQVRPGLHLHDPWVMGKVLHSCDPNMDCNMETMTFTCRKPIRAGELVTMDYDQTEEKLYRPFFCRCGSPNCRGFIQGSNPGKHDEEETWVPAEERPTTHV